jgi:hypothetical protein
MYENTIMTDNTEHAAHLIVLPSESAASLKNVKIDELMTELGMQKIASVSPTNLPRGLAVLFSAAVPSDKRESILLSTASAQFGAPGTDVEYAKSDLQFAEIVAFEPIVPIEESPLQAQVLATLVAKGSGVTIGAFAGFVAVGASPLLLVTVPAGMIICGAVKPVAEALECGLRDRLRDFLRGKAKKKKSPPPGPSIDDEGRSDDDEGPSVRKR